jgi:hypothetical protein
MPGTVLGVVCVQVIYGDTDSIMVYTGSDNLQEVVKLGQQIKKEVSLEMLPVMWGWEQPAALASANVPIASSACCSPMAVDRHGGRIGCSSHPYNDSLLNSCRYRTPPPTGAGEQAVPPAGD